MNVLVLDLLQLTCYKVNYLVITESRGDKFYGGLKMFN